ncbi:MAG TPA: energy transducer TonB [Blastocatellia bacterium]|nr:energy transducer TonB [Blastocatellia bacterium]
MLLPRVIVAVLLVPLLLLPAKSQSGAGGSRAAGREYGVNLNVAVYQYDESKSQPIEPITRLSGTYSSAGDEISHMKDKYKLEEMAVRHIRSVGLRNSEGFNDAVLLGPEYLVFTIMPHDMVRGYMKLDVRVRYGNQTLLEVKGVEFDNFETVAIRGGKGMFGVKYFVGAGGKQDSVPMERTLLVSVTPEIVPVASLRNRPGELSHPVDEFGNPLQIGEGDRFTPPIAVERVIPQFEASRGIRGSVLLGGVVTPEGKMTNIRVLRSLDSTIDQRAVEAFRQFKFSPGMLNGKPIFATYREEITFAPPPPSILDIEEEQRKQREQEREKQKKRRPFPVLSTEF